MTGCASRRGSMFSGTEKLPRDAARMLESAPFQFRREAATYHF